VRGKSARRMRGKMSFSNLIAFRKIEKLVEEKGIEAEKKICT